MKMKIEIYRTHALPNGLVVDEKPETTITNISSFEIHGSYLFYTYADKKYENEHFTLHLDECNYKYIIKLEE